MLKNKNKNDRGGELSYLSLPFSSSNLVPGTQQMFGEWTITWPVKSREVGLNVMFSHTTPRVQSTSGEWLGWAAIMEAPVSLSGLCIGTEFQNDWSAGHREGTKLLQSELCKLRSWWPKFLQIILPKSFNNFLFLQNLVWSIYKPAWCIHSFILVHCPLHWTEKGAFKVWSKQDCEA